MNNLIKVIILSFIVSVSIAACAMKNRTDYAARPDICRVDETVNSDTIAAINRISDFEQDYRVDPIIDSISYNLLQICPASDIDRIPDSVAYIRYLYADGSIRCEGWVAYFNDPEDDSSNPFGEWKYYDEQQGNCYRKFWNYKKRNLIHEAER